MNGYGSHHAGAATLAPYPGAGQHGGAPDPLSGWGFEGTTGAGAQAYPPPVQTWPMTQVPGGHPPTLGMGPGGAGPHQVTAGGGATRRLRRGRLALVVIGIGLIAFSGWNMFGHVSTRDASAGRDAAAAGAAGGGELAAGDGWQDAAADGATGEGAAGADATSPGDDPSAPTEDAATAAGGDAPAGTGSDVRTSPDGSTPPPATVDGAAVGGGGSARAAAGASTSRRGRASGRHGARGGAGRTARAGGAASVVGARAVAPARAASAGRGAAASGARAAGGGAGGSSLPQTGAPSWVAVVLGVLLLTFGVSMHVNAVRIGATALLYRRGPLLRPRYLAAAARECAPIVVDEVRLALQDAAPRVARLLAPIGRLVQSPADEDDFVSCRRTPR